MSRKIVGNGAVGDNPKAGIVVGSKLNVKEIRGQGDDHFAVAQLNVRGEKLCLVSAYFHYADSIEPYLARLKRIVQNRGGGHVLVCADVNARAVLWYNDAINERGEMLIDVIGELNLTIENRAGNPATHQVGRNLDVTLATSSLSILLYG